MQKIGVAEPGDGQDSRFEVRVARSKLPKTRLHRRLAKARHYARRLLLGRAVRVRCVQHLAYGLGTEVVELVPQGGDDLLVAVAQKRQDRLDL